jgi:hypothetical protein
MTLLLSVTSMGADMQIKQIDGNDNKYTPHGAITSPQSTSVAQQVTYPGAGGSAEWRALVERGGDFSAIGYTMITNRPVPGFAHRKVQP